MHRNTLLVIAALAVIAALLIGINVGRSLNQPATISPTLTPTPTLGYLVTSSCGISFTYPASLRAMESSTSGVLLMNSASPDDSIVVVCQKDIPRILISTEKMEKIMIGSVSATLYHDASQKDGTPIDKLIFTHPKTKLDVFIAGFGPLFNELIASLKLE